MELKINSYSVKKILFGSPSSFKEGCLTVDREELRQLLLADENVKDAALDIALPGEETRIINILDAIKPIADTGGANIFPGFLGTTSTAGHGEINQLEDLVLLTCGRFITTDEILRTREAIVDMAGENAKLSPFSLTQNLVLTLTPSGSAVLKVADQALRLAGLKAAAYLASVTKDLLPDRSEVWADTQLTPGLPTVCLVLQLASIGPLFDTYLYGRTVDGILPTLIHSNELKAGAVVSGEYFYGGQRQPTYHYQDNPVVRELEARHGKDLNFGGVVVTRGYYNTDGDKRRAAAYCARLAKKLGADGVVVHAESGGNSHVDAMLTAQACEREKIGSVLILGEMGDENSNELSLVDFVPEATAIVSAANRELLIKTGACGRVIGGKTMIESGLSGGESEDVPLNHYFCSNSQLGAWNLSMNAI